MRAMGVLVTTTRAPVDFELGPLEKWLDLRKTGRNFLGVSFVWVHFVLQFLTDRLKNARECYQLHCALAKRKGLQHADSLRLTERSTLSTLDSAYEDDIGKAQPLLWEG
jgi:hypothetical protein